MLPQVSEPVGRQRGSAGGAALCRLQARPVLLAGLPEGGVEAWPQGCVPGGGCSREYLKWHWAHPVDSLTSRPEHQIPVWRLYTYGYMDVSFEDSRARCHTVGSSVPPRIRNQLRLDILQLGG